MSIIYLALLIKISITSRKKFNKKNNKSNRLRFIENKKYDEGWRRASQLRRWRPQTSGFYSVWYHWSMEDGCSTIYNLYIYILPIFLALSNVPIIRRLTRLNFANALIIFKRFKTFNSIAYRYEQQKLKGWCGEKKYQNKGVDPIDGFCMRAGIDIGLTMRTH